MSEECLSQAVLCRYFERTNSKAIWFSALSHSICVRERCADSPVSGTPASRSEVSLMYYRRSSIRCDRRSAPRFCYLRTNGTRKSSRATTAACCIFPKGSRMGFRRWLTTPRSTTRLRQPMCPVRSGASGSTILHSVSVGRLERIDNTPSHDDWSLPPSFAGIYL